MFPIHALPDAVEQTGPVGIAAAGRIFNADGRHAGDFDLAAGGMDCRAFAAAGDDQRFHFAGQRFDRTPGAFAEQPRLVVVDRAVGGQFQAGEKFVAVEHRQTLAGIEDEGNFCVGELAAVFEHAVASVRRDDAEAHVSGLAHGVEVGMHHRAGVESGDLVVVEIGGDEGLGGEGAGDLRDVAAGQAEGIETVEVGRGVVADGGHDQRLTAEQFEVVGDITGAAAEFATHFGHEEGDVQDVQLLGQDVIAEAILENHDRIEGDGAANERGHEVVGKSAFGL